MERKRFYWLTRIHQWKGRVGNEYKIAENLLIQLYLFIRASVPSFTSRTDHYNQEEPSTVNSSIVVHSSTENLHCILIIEVNFPSFTSRMNHCNQEKVRVVTMPFISLQRILIVSSLSRWILLLSPRRING